MFLVLVDLMRAKSLLKKHISHSKYPLIRTEQAVTSFNCATDNLNPLAIAVVLVLLLLHLTF